MEEGFTAGPVWLLVQPEQKTEHHHGNGLIHQPTSSEQEVFPSLDLLSVLLETGYDV